MERVVVTGLGVISCIGLDVPAFWKSLIGGVSGVDRISAFDPAPHRTQIAAQVKDFAFDPKKAKRVERFSQFAIAAADQALEQSGLELNTAGAIPPERIGVSIGTGIGGISFIEQQHAKFLKRGPGKFHPLTVPIVIANMAPAHVAMKHNLRGPNLCISTACATGNHSIGNAFDLIRLGRADAMLAGGTEAVITPFSLEGYSLLGALSTRNGEPQRASRPFSVSRDGFVLAEGGAVLLLESLSSAKRRGAGILAEVAGFGMTADAHHLTAPDPQAAGAVGAMQAALADAQMRPGQIGYINAHGTSTPLNDALETQAIKRVFGEEAGGIPVSSIKSMVGHALGGAAAIEAVASVLVLVHGAIPPTINLDDPDPELDLDYVPLEARQQRVDSVMSNSLAFGGQNAVTIFRQFA
ncbi:MAG: beta-ketoacyl-ACP synthase II [SAR324 cluster bacterium]|nr:beta-ketoacyl-ACP synthase II [SAR324 cluster bacterium]